MGKLANLALVAKAGKFNPQTLFAGWTDAGLPVLTTNASDLTPEATEQAQTFLRSGYPIPTLSIKRALGVVVVEFAGPVQDLKDVSAKNLVQDTIKIWVKDGKGVSIELTLGELEVMEMMGSNLIVFQRFGSVLDTADRQEAVSYFSFFLPGNSEAGRQDLLVLMRPTNESLGNLIDTIIFMQDVVKKLLLNDERQQPGFKKGYLQAGTEAEKEIQKESQKAGGLLGFLTIPEDQKDPAETLKDMILDFITVPTDGSKARNPLFVSASNSQDNAVPDRKTLDRMVRTAGKMFLFARSRIRS